MTVYILDPIRWSISLGRKFFRVVPYITVGIVVIAVLSQVSSLLSFFLPLKVVMLLGSEGIPGYFPSSFSGIKRNHLIIALSVATICFFLLHIVLEKIITGATNKATAYLLRKSHKMVLFENQEEIARLSYLRYSRALSSAIFLVLSLLTVFLIYFELAVVIFASVFFVASLLVFLCEFFDKIKCFVVDDFSGTLRILSAICFFFSFLFLVFDFVYLTPPSIMYAIIGMLLSRQFLNRTVKLVTDVNALYRQKVKLNALFFHGKSLHPEQPKNSKSVLDVVKFDERSLWLSYVFNDVLGEDLSPDDIRSDWFHSNINNIFMLTAAFDRNGIEEKFLIKVFGARRSSFALHESTLLAGEIRNLPALPWIGSTVLKDFNFSVYKFYEGKFPLPAEVKGHEEKIRTLLLDVEIKASLVSLYTRSKTVLWQRIDESFLSLLYAGVNTDEQRNLVDQVMLLRDEIIKRIRGLPLVLVNKNMNRESLWIAEGTDSALLLNWERWAIEPIGASWPHNPQSMEVLFSAIVRKKRKDFSSISLENVEVAVIIFLIEEACSRQRFSEAIDLLPSLLGKLESCEEM